MICAAHAAVVEAEDRPAVMIVGGFSLCEGCGVDAVNQVAAATITFQKRLDLPRPSPEQIVADEIARCVERGFL